jgi:hypothetical protein
MLIGTCAGCGCSLRLTITHTRRDYRCAKRAACPARAWESTSLSVDIFRIVEILLSCAARSSPFIGVVLGTPQHCGISAATPVRHARSSCRHSAVHLRAAQKGTTPIGARCAQCGIRCGASSLLEHSESPVVGIVLRRKSWRRRVRDL